MGYEDVWEQECGGGCIGAWVCGLGGCIGAWVDGVGGCVGVWVEGV